MRSVPVARAVQQPGEFVVSFPRAFTASIGTGYTLSESVFFATPDWLASATEVYDKVGHWVRVLRLVEDLPVF